jgi:hypothetical protein
LFAAASRSPFLPHLHGTTGKYHHHFLIHILARLSYRAL